MFSRLYPAVYLLMNGLVYFVLAWLFFTDPIGWFGALGVELRNAEGFTELRATYVGLFVGLGIFFLLCASFRQWRGAGMWLAVVSYTGLALARAYGLFVLQEGNGMMIQLLISEAVLVVLALLGLYCLNRQSKRSSNPYL